MRALSLCFFPKVDEEGAEAAAATVMSCCLMSSAYAPSTCFAVDHPFLFFILSGSRTFDRHVTWQGAPFFTLDGIEVKADRMRLTDDQLYARFDSLKAAAVRLPFEQ